MSSASSRATFARSMGARYGSRAASSTVIKYVPRAPTGMSYSRPSGQYWGGSHRKSYYKRKNKPSKRKPSKRRNSKSKHRNSKSKRKN